MISVTSEQNGFEFSSINGEEIPIDIHSTSMKQAPKKKGFVRPKWNEEDGPRPAIEFYDDRGQFKQNDVKEFLD